MVRVNSVSSVVPPHEVSVDETESFLGPHMTDPARRRFRRMLDASRNRTRYAVLPLAALVRLQGAGERGTLYAEHAVALAERAVGGLAELGVLHPETVSTVIFVSSTGWAAPSIDTKLVRRFGLEPRCRRIPLAQLGCAGGVAALALAAEIVRRDPAERVLVVSVELPSLQLQLAEPSYGELVAATQFGDGAAAAVVSGAAGGLEVLDTESVLLPDIEEGGRIVTCETGFRLVSAGGLPTLIRGRVAQLVDRFTGEHHIDARALSFVVAHPRGPEVLQAVGDGLSLAPSSLAASWAAWEGAGNMVSASVFRALTELARRDPPRQGDVGMLLAFGTGVACEMALARWDSAPAVFRA